MELSAESFSTVAESRFTGTPSRVMATLPNRGQIDNLPAGVPVETWTTVDGNGLTPVAAGPVPTCLLGFVQSACTEIELAVEAAITGDRRIAAQAIYTSIMLQNKDCAAELADRLIDAQSRYLPQFFPAKRTRF